MTVGPVVAGAGMALFSLLEPGVSYWKGVFPAAMVLAIGLTITVAPLTAAVLAAVEDRHAGLSSAINNAVARIGGLPAIAVLPALAGIAVGGTGVDLDSGFNTAMYIAGGLSAAGGVVAWFTIRTAGECAGQHPRRSHDSVRARVRGAPHARTGALQACRARSADASWSCRATRASAGRRSAPRKKPVRNAETRLNAVPRGAVVAVGGDEHRHDLVEVAGRQRDAVTVGSTRGAVEARGERAGHARRGPAVPPPTRATGPCRGSSPTTTRPRRARRMRSRRIEPCVSIIVPRS